MSQKKAELLLAAVIIARSTSSVFNKLMITRMEVFNIMALRYLTAFIILLIPFGRMLKGVRLRTVGVSALLSGLFFLVMVFELNGIKHTDASIICFLENSAVVFVPLLTAAIDRKRPEAAVLAGSFTALAGIFIMSLRGGAAGFGIGEILGLTAAMAYTFFIIGTARFISREEAIRAGVLQNGFLGIFALAASLITGTTRLPEGPFEITSIIILAVVCSAFSLTMQPVAQSRMSAERAGIFCALSPLSTGILGMLFLGEEPGILRFAGAFLILAGILLPKLRIGKLHAGKVSPGRL